MKVLLKRSCFVDGQRYRQSIPGNYPVEMPDHLRDNLPSDAVVVGEDYKPPVVDTKEPETLSELGKAMKSKSVAEQLADVQIAAQPKSEVPSGQWPPAKEDESNA